MPLRVKGKVLPNSLQSVGPGADPSVQVVSPQVISQVIPGGRLPLLSARPAVRGATTFSKLGVQFLGLWYYYPSTEKIDLPSLVQSVT